jgi:hypothetical protein
MAGSEVSLLDKPGTRSGRFLDLKMILNRACIKVTLLSRPKMIDLEHILTRNFIIVSYSGDAAAGSLSQKLTAMLSSMQNRVIMPAGDVFMFTGIDIDGTGNLYSHVSYAQGAEGARRI